MANGSKVSLVPTEHGAYVQLVLALGAGLLLGDRGWHAWGQAGLTGLLFLASAPALALLDNRAHGNAMGRAFRILTAYGILALVCGVLAWFGASLETAGALAIPAALASMLAALAFAGRLHTVYGEMLASWSLASSAYPVAILGGAEARPSLLLALALAAIHTVETATVRAFLESQRHERHWLPRAVPPVLGLLLVLLGLAVPVPRVLLLALVPSLAAAIWVLLAPPSPRQVKRLGWLLTVASVTGLLPLLLQLQK